MAKDPAPGKKPEDESPEDQDNLLDDLDLDALLADDDDAIVKDAATGKGRPAAPGAAPAEKQEPLPATNGGSGQEMLFDDGDMDLLRLDEELKVEARAEADEVAAGDLLDLEETSAADERRTTIQPAGEDIAGGDELGELDLLAEDDLGEEAGPKTVPLSAEGSSSTPSREDDERTALLKDDDDEGGAGVKGKGAGGKARQPKPLKRMFGKGPKKLGKKEKVAAGEPGEASTEPETVAAASGVAAKPGKAAPRRALKKEKQLAAPKEKARPAAAVSSHGSIPFICSECYEEFLLPANYSREMVSCPECLHVGKRPDDDFLRTVKLHKAGEQRALLLATATGTLLFLLLLGFLWLKSPYYLEGDKGLEQSVTYGLLGGAGLLAAIFVWLVARFEGNRWEVYF